MFASIFDDHNVRALRTGLGLALIGVLAACATPAPPPPPPPPPPPAISVAPPPKPQPPMGAVADMTIPTADAFGIRETINTNISAEQRLWNLRSALNVAALNCNAPAYVDLVSNYTQFLERYESALRQANLDVAQQFEARYGREGRAVQDSYMTSVYNYYALPPVQRQFCDAALAQSHAALTVEPDGLPAFSDAALTSIEQIYLDFFAAYEQYEADLALWDRLYGPTRGIDAQALALAVEETGRANTNMQPLPTEGPILRDDTVVAGSDDSNPAMQ